MDFLRVLYEQFTPNTSNPFKHSIHSEHFKHSNRFKRVKHFEYVGLSYELKEIDFNALQCVGGLTLRTAGTAQTDTNTPNTRITRMDRMDRMDRIARIA